MRRFISKVLWFLSPFAVLFSLSFLANPESGDLARMAGLRNTHDPHEADSGDASIKILNALKDSSIVIIGDSFLNRSEMSRNVQYHLTNDFKIFPFCTRLLNEENPLNLIKFASDSIARTKGQAPSLVILETVERATSGRIRDLNQAENVQNVKIEHVDFRSPRTAIKRGLIWASSKFWAVSGSHKTGSDKVYQLHKRKEYEESKIPVLMPVYAADAQYEETNNIESEKLQFQLDTLFANASQLFPNSEVLLLIIPDKSSVLAHFYDVPSRNEGVKWEDLHPNVLYPIKPLQEAIEKGIPDVYRWGDTHLGNNGSRIVGDYIRTKSAILSE